jgi:hypothetical protein
MGLKATASHAFEVSDLLIPANCSFSILPESAHDEQPIYKYPFLPFAEATLAVNTSGMTLRFLDICEQLFAERGSDKRYKEEVVMMLNTMLIKARHELALLRHNFYHAVDHSWNPLIVHGITRPDLLADAGASSRTIVRECRRLVQELYPYCGMIAADPRSELNRIWRDLFTASQHTLLTYP